MKSLHFHWNRWHYSHHNYASLCHYDSRGQTHHDLHASPPVVIYGGQFLNLKKKKGLDETNHSGGYCNNEKLRLSCKWCRDLIGSRPYCWIADCIAPFNPIGLIRFGGMHSLTWGGWLRRAKICFSRNIMIRWDVFKMWVITNIYVLTQIKWGFKCLQHSIILENKRSQDKLIPITPDWGYRSHNFSPLRSHERLQYQKTSEYHQNEYVQKKRR